MRSGWLSIWQITESKSLPMSSEAPPSRNMKHFGNWWSSATRLPPCRSSADFNTAGYSLQQAHLRLRWECLFTLALAQRAPAWHGGSSGIASPTARAAADPAEDQPG